MGVGAGAERGVCCAAVWALGANVDRRADSGQRWALHAASEAACCSRPQGVPFEQNARVSRGRQKTKQKSTDPPVHLLNPRPTQPPSDILFLDFFFSTFLGVSRQGEFKNTIKMFLQKVHVENFSQNFNEKFRCRFFLDFFCFIAFSGVSQRWEFKNTTKNGLQKKSCRKVVTKNSTKNPKPIVFSKLFLSRFWAFLDEGKKISKK
jgi:hypothetical protein